MLSLSPRGPANHDLPLLPIVLSLGHSLATVAIQILQHCLTMKPSTPLTVTQDLGLHTGKELDLTRTPRNWLSWSEAVYEGMILFDYTLADSTKAKVPDEVTRRERLHKNQCACIYISPHLQTMKSQPLEVSKNPIEMPTNCGSHWTCAQ